MRLQRDACASSALQKPHHFDLESEFVKFYPKAILDQHFGNPLPRSGGGLGPPGWVLGTSTPAPPLSLPQEEFTGATSQLPSTQ
jgi:hypothetical protein